MRNDEFELEVLPGLEHICAQEAVEKLGGGQVVTGLRSGAVSVEPTVDVDALRTLRTANSVYAVVTAPVPRPKALLGHQYWTRIVSVCREIVRGDPSFRTLGLDAAGAQSSVMQRIKTELADSLGLVVADEKGDLHVRIRPVRDGNGWQVLVRVTPRPLATRPWRVHNYEGALNACVAAAMIRLAKPTPADCVLNVCCGSGTLMVELNQAAIVRQCIGVDVNTDALSLASAHLAVAQVDTCALLAGDATALPLHDNSASLILADLPFGQRVGSHAENLVLYPALIDEAARVGAAGARLVLITHEKRLIRQIVHDHAAWEVVKELEINQNGLHPVIVVLERR
ncbi:MAG: methyltransferase domain-containing protein [Chloroflexi bacterium]|nr:methyltransferase domain-containing protein [Chloroflexota bacterium]